MQEVQGYKISPTLTQQTESKFFFLIYTPMHIPFRLLLGGCFSSDPFPPFAVPPHSHFPRAYQIPANTTIRHPLAQTQRLGPFLSMPKHLEGKKGKRT